jgi:hypothetical protein
MLNNIAYIYYVIHMYVVTSQSQLMALWQILLFLQFLRIINVIEL